MYISVGERISETIKLFHAVYTFLFVKKKIACKDVEEEFGRKILLSFLRRKTRRAGETKLEREKGWKETKTEIRSVRSE